MADQHPPLCLFTHCGHASSHVVVTASGARLPLCEGHAALARRQEADLRRLAVSPASAARMRRESATTPAA